MGTSQRTWSPCSQPTADTNGQILIITSYRFPSSRELPEPYGSVTLGDPLRWLTLLIQKCLAQPSPTSPSPHFPIYPSLTQPRAPQLLHTHTHTCTHPHTHTQTSIVLIDVHHVRGDSRHPRYDAGIEKCFKLLSIIYYHTVLHSEKDKIWPDPLNSIKPSHVVIVLVLYSGVCCC